MSRLFSYIVRMDYGFAPNPFEGFCTLATCKHRIRCRANVGDWIVGTGSVENNRQNKLIYIMKVTEKIHYEDYWSDERFKRKKPDMDGSIKNRMGDNIYEYIGKDELDNNSWLQHDSHHSLQDGKEREETKNDDLKCKYVLISSDFYYFGEAAVRIIDRFRKDPDIVQKGQGYKSDFTSQFIDDFVKWVKEVAIDKELGVKDGILGFPAQFGDMSRLVNKRR